eukprot:scaffold10235_cov131-Skeletonema_marinoi.AAC.13
MSQSITKKFPQNSVEKSNAAQGVRIYHSSRGGVEERGKGRAKAVYCLLPIKTPETALMHLSSP